MTLGFCRFFQYHLLLLSSLVLCSFGASYPSDAEQKYSIPLTLQDRVHFQHAIEQVYWNHRIWPKENKSAKPPLDTVLPEASLRTTVEDYVKKSNTLFEEWRHPITPEQLQAEMNRMARTSRKPDVLRELFAALGDDPYVIAECLARPILADRLIHNWYSNDSRFHGSLKQQAESELRRYGSAAMVRTLSGQYTEAEWVLSQNNDATTSRSGPSVITLDPEQWKEWTSDLRSRFAVTAGRPGGASRPLPVGVMSQLKEDETGFSITTVLDSRLDRIRVAVVRWQKQPFDVWWIGRKQLLPADLAADPAVYALPAITASSCTNDTWTGTGASPSGRIYHTAVWTGSEMIVWGGQDISSRPLNNGGRYDPSTDSWTPTSSTGAPAARFFHTSVWTGSQMIVWGGFDGNTYFNDGGRYDPSTDTWTAPTTVGMPEARGSHTAIWTGSQMIVWGGFDNNIIPVYLNTGGRYNPSTDTWLSMSTTNAPTARDIQTAIWTGSEMIVWGGYNSISFNTGGRYDPSTDSWTATSSTGAPAARFRHTAVWTGSQMIVWGGFDDLLTPLDSGGRYDPSTDSWTSTSTIAPAAARAQHTAVWTGLQMIVWGGFDGFGAVSTGGRYDPSTDTWTATASAGAPVARFLHTAVWSGSELIVWGGQTNSNFLETGGRYDPSTDTWTSTSTIPAALARTQHTAVWTGSHMIVWGGNDGLFNPLNTGGRYDPSTNTWTPTSTAAAPEARYEHTAVWTGTGSQMIVWGGQDTVGSVNTGGRYDPSSDTWIPTSTIDAPAARVAHTSVWTGSKMIVWGGFAPAPSNTGGLYDPSTDTWIPTSTTAVPDARVHHTAVWTGSQMIIWGGYDSNYFNTGGLYDPSTDTWTTTSTTGAPVARYAHTAIWTGTQMIVWGGYDSVNDFRTGGRFDPSADTWTPTSLTAAPDARFDHTVVWTGSEMIVWGGRTLSAGSLDTGGRYCALPPVPCLFCDDFEDGVLATDWTYIKPAWSETGGDLIGTPAGKKAVTVATPAFAGCQVCSVESTISTAGGVGNRIWLMGWYLDKKNTVELMMKQENGKWILKELSGGKTVAKGKGFGTILPNVSYDAIVQFDGTQFIVTVDGTEVLRMTPAAAVPSGTVGFQVKSTTAHFGEIIVN